MPKNLQAKVCDYDSAVASALESVDWCTAAEEKECYPVEKENESENLSDTTRLQEPLSSIIANQEIIYKYLQESVENLNQSIKNLQYDYQQDADEPVLDEKELQRLQLQAQIAALQSEMENL